jgi:hypothetical protein
MAGSRRGGSRASFCFMDKVEVALSARLSVLEMLLELLLVELVGSGWTRTANGVREIGLSATPISALITGRPMRYFRREGKRRQAVDIAEVSIARLPADAVARAVVFVRRTGSDPRIPIKIASLARFRVVEIGPALAAKCHRHVPSC